MQAHSPQRVQSGAQNHLQMPIGSSRCPSVPPGATKALASGLEVNRTQTHGHTCAYTHALTHAGMHTHTQSYTCTHTQLHQLVEQEAQGMRSAEAWIPGWFLTVAAPAVVLSPSRTGLSQCFASGWSESSPERPCSCLWQDEDLGGGGALCPAWSSFSLF